MKKKIAVLITTLCLTLTGCGESVINEQGVAVQKYGPYIEIKSEIGYYEDATEMSFITVYDRESKIVYQMIKGYHTFSIMPLYAYDDAGHPVLQFYEDGKIVTK